MLEARAPDAPSGAAGQTLNDAQRLAWLRLIRSENVGPATFRALVNRYGGADAALDALPELSARGGLKRKIRICTADDARRELDRAAKRGVVLVAAGEPDFPAALAHAEGSPPLLYVKGQPAMLRGPMAAIVGSRNCSAAGRRMAATIAADLGAGIIIVSGLARGIDAAAHQASLGTGTAAVVAGGVDVVYPEENQALYDEIAGQGAVVSEMPLGLEPRGRDFPRRNRIIAGLALGTVIVEAARRSGSLISARLAGEMGRDVFAVPGSPLDPRSEGTNRLIRDGAILTRGADDVVEALALLLDNPDRLAGGAAGALPLADGGDAQEDGESWDDKGKSARDTVFDALTVSPVEMDDLVRHTGLAAGRVRVVLLELELAGRIVRHGGNRVSLG